MLIFRKNSYLFVYIYKYYRERDRQASNKSSSGFKQFNQRGGQHKLRPNQSLQTLAKAFRPNATKRFPERCNHLLAVLPTGHIYIYKNDENVQCLFKLVNPQCFTHMLRTLYASPAEAVQKLAKRAIREIPSNVIGNRCKQKEFGRRLEMLSKFYP